MTKPRAVKQGRRIVSLDVLGEVRRAMRTLRRVEKFLTQQERAERRRGTATRPAAAPRGGDQVKGERMAYGDPLLGE